MIVRMTLLVAGTTMAFAVHQWRRSHHMMAIGFIAFALVMAGVAIESVKNNQNAGATEVLPATRPPR
jgi:glucose uptake protein GlcU